MKTGTLHHVFYVGRSEFSVLYSHIDDSHNGVFFFLLYRFVLVVGVIFWCERVYPEGGRGLLPYVCLIDICAAPKGMVFALFWSENGCRLCLFLSKFGFSFRGDLGVLGSICRFNFK